MESIPAEREVEEIESLCMNCHEDGTTRLLLTKIPFFREIVIMSFECPECGFKNSEIQNAGEIQQKGIKCTFRLDTLQDLQRQIVKGDSCVFRIEDIDLEIPAGRGQLTNIEGLITMVKDDLNAKQLERKELDKDLYEKIEDIIQKLDGLLTSLASPFTVSIDDPTGNSSIEPSPNDHAGKYTKTVYPRSPAQNEALGLSGAESSHEKGAPDTKIRPEYHPTGLFPDGEDKASREGLDQDDDPDIVENQIYSFQTLCPGCMGDCDTHMKMVKIPHFKQVVLMSTNCEHCGYRTSEVKSGGEVPLLGRRITLTVLNAIDMSRDILKSESCALTCPELSLNVEPGTLGGRFTTVEGLLSQIRDDLRKSVFDTGDEGVPGDSMESGTHRKWEIFFSGLELAIKGDIAFKLILEDPLAGSYVQSLTAPEPDPQIEIEDYERTEEEEEHLGLRDMKTEGYEADADAAEKEVVQKNEAEGETGGDDTDIDHNEEREAVVEQLKEID